MAPSNPGDRVFLGQISYAFGANNIDLLPPVTLLVLGMLATKTLGQPSLPVAASISEKLLQALFAVAVIMAFARMF